MGSFKAGVTKVNITPPVGIHLAGFALRNQPSMGVHDELYARAIVLEDGEERVALVSADLGGLEVKSAQWIRNEAYRLTGIEPGKIIVACTHTHSGPATYFTRYIEQLDEHYVKVLERKILGSIFWANRELKEVSIGTGSGVVKGVGYNRESGVGGATDEELGVIRVDNRKDGVECVVLNYTCHPTVLGPKNLMISADYSGAASCFVEENLARCCLFTSGACGDINPLVKLSNRDKVPLGTSQGSVE